MRKLLFSFIRYVKSLRLWTNAPNLFGKYETIFDLPVRISVGVMNKN